MTQEIMWILGGIGVCIVAGTAGYIGIVERLAYIKGQINRIASDLESEKKVRIDVNKDFESRLRSLEKYEP